jgi:hypothetical protein
MDEDPSQIAASFAAGLMNLINLLGYIASPRLVIKAQQMPSREHFLEHIDQYLEVVERARQSPDNPGTKTLMAAEPYARKLRELCEGWEPSPDVPVDIVQTARTLLAIKGIPEPPGGWDQFEGWPDEPPADAGLEPSSFEPRPTLRQIMVSSILAGLLVGPFHLGIGGPGGFTILVRPSVRLGDEVLVPDLAAWSAERAPSPTDEPCTSLIPDWVCEVRGLRAPARDFSDKMSAYAREGVRFMWILDPADQTMALFKLDAQRRWELSGAYSASHGPSRVRGEPFDAIEVDLALLLRR